MRELREFREKLLASKKEAPAGNIVYPGVVFVIFLKFNTMWSICLYHQFFTSAR
jgi:hypothetical protein